MTRFAIGKGGRFRIDSNGNMLFVYRNDGQKIYTREVGTDLGAETPVCYGDEAVMLDGGKILRRVKSRLEII